MSMPFVIIILTPYKGDSLMKTTQINRSKLKCFFCKYKLATGLLCLFLTQVVATVVLQIFFDQSLWKLLPASLFLYLCICGLAYTVPLCEYFLNNISPKQANQLKKFLYAIIWITPAIIGYCTIDLAQNYFSQAQELGLLYDTIPLVSFTVVNLFFISIYTIDLGKSLRKKRSLSYQVQIFLFTIIHLIQLFAGCYLAIYLIDSEAFSVALSADPRVLYFELIYLSTMTLLGGNCTIEPSSILAKSVVILETFLFVVVISIIILTFMSERKEDSSKD